MKPQPTQQGFGIISDLSLFLGAPCDVTDNRGWFPVHEAADKGHSICLQVLLDHKSDDLLNSRTYCGETPIFLATLKGHIDCVKLLMAFGAQVNVMNDEEVDLLVAAVKGGNKECFEVSRWLFNTQEKQYS